MSRIKLNTIYLLNELKPILEDFCADFGYFLPDNLFEYQVVVLDKLDKEVNDSWYGSHQYITKTINISPLTTFERQASTLAHEFVHAIQAENFGPNWINAYRYQLDTVGYRDNLFEKQARKIQDWLTWEIYEGIIAKLAILIGKTITKHKEELSKLLYPKVSWTYFEATTITRRQRKLWAIQNKHHETRYKGRR